MALSNHERIGKALSILSDGLLPFAQRELKLHLGEAWEATFRNNLRDGKPINWSDPHFVLGVMWDQWNTVFKNTLGHAERSIVSELRDARNKWAHQTPFSTDDAYRTLDSIHRLLLAVSAPQAEEIEKMKMELLRLRFDEQVRGEKRKTASTAMESAVTGTMTPWRDVITPHQDVASGQYQQAEFAADLWQVHIGEGTDEYRDPVEFFRRTFLTESLKQLLIGSASRLSGKGGDPVVQLQTNFGGGKTHSMLALYHMFSGIAPTDLAGVDEVFAQAGVTSVPRVKRVVLDGHRISPGNPTVKPDGTAIRTLWGELAWQLGGKEAFLRIEQDDINATSPGDALRELFIAHGPTLILIDEWVAYARQLHDQSDLPAGSFETQFTFAQLLTESAKGANNCLLVVSLPASDKGTSPHAQADDAEVGGVRGREALDRLRNVIGRMESSWRPASAEEGFEIVRRRLFEPLVTQEQFKQRDVICREFHDLYRAQQQEFPHECHESDYEKRLKAAYPIHPEIFDRLYSDWSTLVKFQRTRGVLRLMAAVIHSLWEKGDRNPLILPSMLPIDDPRVQSELTRYLSDNWAPVIEKDVDGPNSLPLRIDSEVPNLGKMHACRRVARTIYLGSAPTSEAAHRGIEDRRVKLGCVMPGESPAVYGDALRRLASVATFLYQDGPRVWYSTQPTVTKLAEDRAAQLMRVPDKIAAEIEDRLRADLKSSGGFSRIHPSPRTGADVPDDLDARLVVLGIDHLFSKEKGNAAETAAKTILELRGNTPRMYRNTLVFLAGDKVRMQDLDEAVRKFLAWESILAEKDTLNLDPHQVKQAETQKRVADGTVTARLPETYQWLLVPMQSRPDATLEWQAIRLTGSDSLAARAFKRLRNDELLITSFGASRLRMELDRIPLWRGDHVAIRQLVEDFSTYLYLPRLADPWVLYSAIRDGLALLTWESESFAFADSHDDAAGRYLGLRCGEQISSPLEGTAALLVKPDTAIRQREADAADRDKKGKDQTPEGDQTANGGSADPEPTPTPAPVKRLTRYHGAVSLSPQRMGRDAGQIAEEIVAHLLALPGATLEVTLEIEAEMPQGAPENVVRTVTENGRTLKFGSQGFEEE